MATEGIYDARLSCGKGSSFLPRHIPWQRCAPVPGAADGASARPR